MLFGLMAADIALIDMIMLGHLENRPVDISSLSHLIKMPRPTVRRHVRRLEENGWLIQRSEGRHNHVYLTECAMDAIGQHLDALYSRVQRMNSTGE